MASGSRNDVLTIVETLAEFTRRWLSTHRTHKGTPLSVSSVRQYTSDMRHVEVLLDIPLPDLTPAMVEQWWHGMDPERSSLNTRVLRTLGSVLAAAASDSTAGLGFDPSQLAFLPEPSRARPKEPRPPHTAPAALEEERTTLELVGSLLDFPADHGLSPRGRTALLVLCGIRRGDLRVLADAMAELWRAGLARRNLAGGWSPTERAWTVVRGDRPRRRVDPSILH